MSKRKTTLKPSETATAIAPSPSSSPQPPQRLPFKTFSARANYYATSLAVPTAVVGGIVGIGLQATGHGGGGPVWMLCAWGGAIIGMVLGYLYALFTRHKML